MTVEGAKKPLIFISLFVLACSGQGEVNDLEVCGNTASCGGSQTYAIDELRFSPLNSDGSIEGFDLDGLDSDKSDTGGCKIEDLVSPSGKTGVDNQLGVLIDLGGTAINDTLPEAIQDMINSGSLALLMELMGVDSLDQKSHGQAVFRAGHIDPLIGTNDRYLQGQTFSVDQRPLLGYTDKLQIKDGVALVGPFDLDFRFFFLSTPIRLTFQSTHLQFTKNDDGSISGVVGGYVSIEDIFAVTGFFVGETDRAVGDFVQAVVPGLADIKDEAGDCTGMSGAIEFHAVPAFILNDVSLDPEKPLSPQELFSRATCRGCHAVAVIPGATNAVGPPLDNLFERASNAVPGLSAEAYIRQSILEPSAHVVEGFEDRMVNNLERWLSDEELDTLISWLLTL